jgi:DNA invertase Pin-like site-specific DNA recombinase
MAARPKGHRQEGISMNRAVGYIRVSTSDQSTEGVSLEAQRARITSWCHANDYELIAIFEDAGLSGSSMLRRDGLHAAVKAAVRGTALVSYSISRLARSTRDMLELADRLERQGADLVSLTEKIDTTSAAGRMVFRMLAVLAEFERELIGERTKMALAHKKAKGEKYGPVPFGFEEVEGRLIEVRLEAQAVAAIVRMRESGLAYRQIADQLNTSGITGKRGGQWHASTVRYVINRQAA